MQTDDLDLAAGVTDVSVRYDGALLHAAGPGTYCVLDLTLTPVDESKDTMQAPPVGLVVADVSGWVGTVPDPATLVQRWRAAAAAGEIRSRGLLTPELQGLEHVEADDDEGQVARAVEGLERVVQHVEESRSGDIDGPAATRLIAYARQVRDALLAGPA